MGFLHLGLRLGISAYFLKRTGILCFWFFFLSAITFLLSFDMAFRLKKVFHESRKQRVFLVTFAPFSDEASLAKLKDSVFEWKLKERWSELSWRSPKKHAQLLREAGRGGGDERFLPETLTVHGMISRAFEDWIRVQENFEQLDSRISPLHGKKPIFTFSVGLAICLGLFLTLGAGLCSAYGIEQVQEPLRAMERFGLLGGSKRKIVLGALLLPLWGGWGVANLGAHLIIPHIAQTFFLKLEVLPSAYRPDMGICLGIGMVVILLIVQLTSIRKNIEG